MLPHLAVLLITLMIHLLFRIYFCWTHPKSNVNLMLSAKVSNLLKTFYFFLHFIFLSIHLFIFERVLVRPGLLWLYKSVLLVHEGDRDEQVYYGSVLLVHEGDRGVPLSVSQLDQIWKVAI